MAVAAAAAPEAAASTGAAAAEAPEASTAAQGAAAGGQRSSRQPAGRSPRPRGGRRTSSSSAAPPSPAPEATAQGAPPQNYALLQGQTRSGFGSVVWTLAVAFVTVLLLGLILIPGRSGGSGAGAIASILNWFDGVITSAVSTRPFFVPKGATG